MNDAVPAQRSFLMWAFESLGFPYTALLLLTGLGCFVLTLVLVIRGRGPMATPALLLIVHLPLFIGIFAALQGAIASYTLIATSGTTPKPSQVAMGISTALIAPLVAILVMLPSYLAAALGGLVRALLFRETPTAAK